MNYGPELLLVAAVATVGVLHTIVPDHWVPITLIARQRGWSKSETARAALQAGIGHVLSTLLIALVVWLAGVAFAQRFGHIVDTVSSLALIAFGGWFAISAWRDLRKHGGHGHSHSHDFPHLHGNDQGAHPSPVHGPELRRIATEEGVLELSIFETGVPPRFRLSSLTADTITVRTRREGNARQDFRFANRGTYWESVEQIPEPHQFAVSVIINQGSRARRYETQFTEHDHGHHEHSHDYGHGHDHERAPEDDPLYAPLRGETAVLTRHLHAHRHERGSVHSHWHDHTPASSHSITAEIETAPPTHDHRHKTTARTALLLILGSSPMVEGIPAFFAAGKYGIGLIVVMAVVFAISTIATYVLLCVYSTAGLQRVRLGAFERYGEVVSGAFIALVGLAFWIWPVL
jgi:ABC-type nickel/cobalt efflux system permease component RcnA